MLNRKNVVPAALLSAAVYVTCQLQVPAVAQSQATSEADSQATSFASSQASSQASAESELIYGRTGYQIYQAHYPSFIPNPSPNQVWPPAYMQPLAANGSPAYSQVDPSWVYWDGFQPTAPATRPFIETTPVPLPQLSPRRQFGFARLIPHAQRGNKVVREYR